MLTQSTFRSDNDTSRDARQVLDGVLRRMSPQKKWMLLHRAQRTARILAEAGYRLLHPQATIADVQRHWLASRVPRLSESTAQEPLTMQAGEDVQVVREVVEALDRLAIQYALGGSMASSVYGVVRYTQDVDLTVDPFAGQEQALADCFGADHYVSVAAMRQANERRASFNIIHRSIGFKVDLFVRQERAFEQSAMSRRMPIAFPDRPEQPIFVLSPEDVMLFKLEWYRIGGESSERQWLDVAGVLRVQSEHLDRDYLNTWAAQLNVQDLLTQAITEAGI